MKKLTTILYLLILFSCSSSKIDHLDFSGGIMYEYKAEPIPDKPVNIYFYELKKISDKSLLYKMLNNEKTFQCKGVFFTKSLGENFYRASSGSIKSVKARVENDKVVLLIQEHRGSGGQN